MPQPSTTQPVRQWTSTAGPLQTKAVNVALQNLKAEHNQYVELEGVIGGTERSHNYYSPFGNNQRDDVTQVQTEIAEQFNYTITKANYTQILDAIHAALSILQTNRPVEDKRRSFDEERQRLEQVEHDQLERQEKERQHNEEVARITEELRKKYPWAKPNDNTVSRQARAAANLRKELALAFPNTKFSVRSDSASMTNSVSYRWTLGPTTAAVTAIADKYEYGRFDAMQDLSTNDHSAYGEAVEQVLGRAKYVSGSREIPQHIREQAGRLLCQAQNVEFMGDYTQKLFGERDNQCLSDHVYQLLSRTTFDLNCEITGIEWTDGGRDETTGAYTESGYQLTFSEPATPCNTCGATFDLHTLAGPDILCPTPTTLTPTTPGTSKITVTENPEKAGIELRFPDKPPQNILDQLHDRANGAWRYHRKEKFWYAKASENTRGFAQRLLAA